MNQATAILGCSRPTIYALERRGDLRIIRDRLFPTHPIQIPYEDVERLLARRQGSAA